MVKLGFVQRIGKVLYDWAVSWLQEFEEGFVFVFEAGTHFVVQASLEQIPTYLPECWGCATWLQDFVLSTNTLL